MWLRYRNGSTETRLRTERRFLAGQNIFSSTTAQTDLRHTSDPIQWLTVNLHLVPMLRICGSMCSPHTFYAVMKAPWHLYVSVVWFHCTGY